MTDRKTDSSKLVKHVPRATLSRKSKFNSFIDSIKDAEKLAEYVINSDTFGTAFEKRVDVLDEKGNPVLDKDNNKVTKVIKNKADVIAAIVLGAELGIEPMAAITLGKRLDANAYIKVSRGKKLGLDPMTSLDLIHIIPTKNGQTVSTGVHVIQGVMLKAGIKIKILEDFVPTLIEYTDFKTKTNINYDENKHIIINNITKEQLERELKAGKTPVLKKILDRRTTVEFIRENYEPLVMSYTLQEATDAELYKGKTTDGEEIKGKDNWNKHPATMLRNRCITIGGRVIAADYLDGMYSNEEAMEFTEYEILDEEKEVFTDELKEEENYSESTSANTAEN